MNSSVAPGHNSEAIPPDSRVDGFSLSFILFDIISGTTASVANFLLLFTIFKDPHRNLRRSPSTQLVINMAVADFLTGFCCAYQLMVYDSLRLSGMSEESTDNFLLVTLAIIAISLVVVCCNVVAMACDRWLAVSSALYYRSVVTAKRVKALIVTIWIYAVVFTSFLFCPGIPRRIFELLYCNLHVSVPLLVLPALYLRTFRLLEQQARLRTACLGCSVEHTELRRAQSEKKTAKAFVTILLLFFVAFLPYTVTINLRNLCSAGEGKIELVRSLQIAFRFVFVNACVDPFVYAWRIPKYAQAVTTILIRYRILRGGRRRGRSNSTDPESTAASREDAL